LDGILYRNQQPDLVFSLFEHHSYYLPVSLRKSPIPMVSSVVHGGDEGTAEVDLELPAWSDSELLPPWSD
jgi:hypothetical protein